MRDPARIPRILAKLEEVWTLHPDWRLSQVIVACRYGNDRIFFYDDDRLEARLDEIIAKRGSVGVHSRKSIRRKAASK